MFGNKEKKKEIKLANVVNILGLGTEITGNLNTNNDVRIDGKIFGDVISKAKVVIGETGEVIGNIIACSVELSGLVEGNIECSEQLFLKATAKINGNIAANKLVIENGASFTGFCKTGLVKENIIADDGKKISKIIH